MAIVILRYLFEWKERGEVSQCMKLLQILFFSFFSCVPYVPDPENTTLLKTAVELYRKFNQYPQALRFAMQLNDIALIEEIFLSCKDM